MSLQGPQDPNNHSTAWVDPRVADLTAEVERVRGVASMSLNPEEAEAQDAERQEAAKAEREHAEMLCKSWGEAFDRAAAADTGDLAHDPAAEADAFITGAYGEPSLAIVKAEHEKGATFMTEVRKRLVNGEGTDVAKGQAEPIPAGLSSEQADMLQANGYAVLREQILGPVQAIGQMTVPMIETAIAFTERGMARMRLQGAEKAQVDGAGNELEYLRAVLRFRKALGELDTRLAARAKVTAP